MKKMLFLLTLLFALPFTQKAFCYNYSALESEYGISIQFGNIKDSWNNTKYTPMTNNDKERYGPLLEQALENYSKQIFARIGLKSIKLARNLYYRSDMRSAIPDNFKNSLYLGIADNYSDDYIIHCIIHELNHYIEYYIWKDYRYSWTQYNKLYNGSRVGGEYAYQDRYTNYYSYIPDLSGFMNLYSQTAPEEDRSEIIAFYFTSSQKEHSQFLEKSLYDENFRQKVEMVLDLYEKNLGYKNLIQNYYAEINEYYEALEEYYY